MSTIKDQLAQDLAEIEWNLLIPHVQRDAVIVVSKSLNFLDVAVAIASDDTTLVQQWIKQQLIHKPTVDELSTWNIYPEQKFQALIVQPFIVVSAPDSPSPALF